MAEEGISAPQLGSRVGTTGNMINKISAPENASYFRRPPWELMRRIAEETGVLPNEFVFPDGIPEHIQRKRRKRCTQKAA